MSRIGKFEIVLILFYLVPIIIFVYVIMLVIKALKKYINSKDTQVSEENINLVQSLGDTLKAERLKNNMTQEFVAEKLGVTRQAVSKWESGKADPSTSNLISLCKLYDIPADQLLKSIE